MSRNLKNGIRKYKVIVRKHKAIKDIVHLWQKEIYDKSFVGFFFKILFSHDDYEYFVMYLVELGNHLLG